MSTMEVLAADNRKWQLQSSVAWTSPATRDDFEHDVAGGYTPIVVMAVLLLLLIVVLVAWTPDSVVVPGWLVLILVLVVAIFPARWLLRRPWTLVARTNEIAPSEEADEDEDVPLHWVGTVRGPFAMRAERSRVAKSIRQYSLPDYDGVLQPVE